ncbi:hypothetical protein M9H77_30792 [Catharanthus roseus]|uniref:Uncharacterized protein n=1 Tax=Catharanthus roseus TaxID=4058 RepID=A0ACB9ZY87_CATRO|nr:hypothetical protein M9H77_30792 [Catharanthus roseus]
MGLSFDILQNISVEKDQVPVIHVLRSRIGNIMDPTPARDPSTAFGGIGPFLEVGSKANTFEQQAPSERNGSKDVGQLGIEKWIWWVVPNKCNQVSQWGMINAGVLIQRLSHDPLSPYLYIYYVWNGQARLSKRNLESEKLERRLLLDGEEEKKGAVRCGGCAASVRPTSAGGLGFKRLQHMNVALLAKLDCRLLHNNEQLWAKGERINWLGRDAVYSASSLKGRNMGALQIEFNMQAIGKYGYVQEVRSTLVSPSYLRAFITSSSVVGWVDFNLKQELGRQLGEED